MVEVLAIRNSLKAGRKMHTFLYGFLRVLRAFAGVVAVSAVPNLNLFGIVIFGAAFFALRNFINWLHTRQRGTPHPALKNVWGL
jgi:hypothetical protein